MYILACGIAFKAGIQSRNENKKQASDKSKKSVHRASSCSHKCMLCREDGDPSQHHDIVIHANELSYNAGLSTGDIIR